ncbi:hypothetical protein jhhlp_000227 [Lomentospora prolificans]|uniref:DNA-binding protein RAP1 n=1 Tax=Lomentospora prolificans TaxID=41688 RepID=A0A2N3NKC0_9PEZI|nr:hypothetical protein jhhlp_000227 [Lomentospora prolificans]
MADSNSGIFHGIKFWLAQRIPSRPHFKSLVEENGGTVVALDKRADILIADHARQDVPPNSFSWRFIDESVKEGRLLEREDYRIGRARNEPRRVASREPTKGHRNAFSAADDLILAAWVSKHENLSGNVIYTQLERLYPHHSWQSWRNRWVKRLSSLPADVLERMVTEAQALREESPTSTPATPRPHQRTQSVQEPSNLPATQPTPSRQPSQRTPRRREPPREREASPPFTSTDDDILERHVRSMVEKGKMWNGKSIYEELAKQHPHHSATSWQNRFAGRWRDNQVDMKDWNSRSKRLSSQNESPQSTRATSAVQKAPQTQTNTRTRPIPAPSDAAPEEEPKKLRFYQDLNVYLELKNDWGEPPTIRRWHEIRDVSFELWDLYQAVMRQGCDINEVDWELVAEDMKLDWVAAPETAEILEGCWDKYLSRFYDLTSGFTFDTQEADEIEAAALEDEAMDTEQDADEAEKDAEEEVEKGPRVETEVAVAAEVAESRDEDSEDDGFETPNNRQAHRRPHTLPAARQASSLLPSSPPARGSERRARFGQSSPTLTDRLPQLVSTLKRKRISRHSEIPSTPDSQLKPKPAAGHDDVTPTRKRRRVPPAETDTLVEEQKPEVEEEEAEAEHATPMRRKTLQLASTAPHSSSHRSVDSDRITKTIIRTRPTTTAITTETRPASSSSPPQNTTLRAASRQQPRARTIPEQEPSPPPAATDNPPAEEQKEAEAEEEEEEEDNSEEVFATIERFEAQGYPRDIVVEGLFRTSMDPHRAPLVMKSLKRGGGVPEGQTGIWTSRDDKRLKALDAASAAGRGAEKIREALLKKHGLALVDARRRFLADAEAVGFSFD